MGEAVGQILPLAVVVALSPIPIIAVVLMLSTPRGSANGPAFLLGWAIGLALVGAVVLLIAGGADASDQGEPAKWVSWLKLVLGLLMLWIAIKTWRSRPRAGEPIELPSWMRSVDRFTAGRSIAMGIALSAINPKNLLLTVGAAVTIAQSGLSTGREAACLAVFIVVALIGPTIPVLMYFAMRERATSALADLQGWLAAHNAAIMTVICLVIAAKLIGDALPGLT